MVKKCANPSCDRAFRYFRGGKLFLVERRQPVETTGAANQSARRGEYFWLCEVCASALTVTLGANGCPDLKLRHAS